MLGTERRRQRSHHAEYGWDCRDPDLAGQLVLQPVDLVAHGAGVTDNAPGPVERPFAFGGETLEARATLDQHHAQNFLELLEPGRHGRLRHAAGLRRASEMSLLRECQQKFKLVEQPVVPSDYVRRMNASTPQPSQHVKTGRRNGIDGEFISIDEAGGAGLDPNVRAALTSLKQATSLPAAH